MRKFLLLLLLTSPLFAQTTRNPSNPLGNDIRAASTNCSVTSSCVWMALPANATTMTATVTNGASGAFTGTLQFEESSDSGITFIAASPASTAAPGVFTFTITSFTDFRVRGSAFAGGDAAVNLQASGGGGSGGGGGGSSFPVTTPVTVGNGGSITPTGTGTITSTSVTNAPTPSSAFTFYPATDSTCLTYSATGTNFCAVDSNTGAVTTNTDARVLINAAIATRATVGGTLYFKNGVYNINSMTVDTTTGCNSFQGSGAALAYGINFPANTVATSVQWLLVGESAPVWVGESLATTVNNNGVIFNVTPTAVASVAAGTILTGFWQRPIATCTITATNASNDIHFKNMDVRFPVNTRGNEVAFAPYFAQNIEYENTIADFNVPYNTLAIGAAPTKGSYGLIGLATTGSGNGNYQHFLNTFASGYDIAYDFQSEHVIGEVVTAIYSNFACEFGRSGTPVFHPSWIEHFVDQENGAGCIWGPQMIQSSAVDVYFDFELGTDANWYTTARAGLAKLSESNCNVGTGLLRYGVTKQGVGSVGEAPSTNLFTSCGGNFDFQEVAQKLNYAYQPASDSFTRPNAVGWGPAWESTGSTSACAGGATITSNAATTGSNATCYWVSQAFNGAQFAQQKVSSVSSTTFASVTVLNSNISSNAARYGYGCSTSGGLVTNREILIYNAGGTASTLVQTAGASGCTAGGGDVLELDVIPTGTTNLLLAYYTVNGGTAPVLDLITTDATLTAGSPGITLAGGAGVSVTNWRGGSLPSKSGIDTIYSQPMFARTYNTLTNCAVNSVSPAACGTAAAGAFVVPTTTAAYTVNTTAVTATSRIQITPMSFAGNLPTAPTCVVPTTPFIATVSAISAGVSFSLTLPSTTGQTCWQYAILN